jgi:FMN phosphatase YigB (HAD superfamily)
MIKAIIFDMGGVLLKTEDRSGREKWERHFGIPEGDLDRIVFNGPEAKLAGIGKANKSDVWKGVGNHFGIVGSELAQLETDFWIGDRIDARLFDYIIGKRKMYKTGILSNAWPEARRMLEEKYKVLPAFDLIIISAEEGIAKPDPRIYRITADRLGVPTSECIFVDDFVENIAGAAEVGMLAVRYENTQQTIEDVERLLNAFG